MAGTEFEIVYPDADPGAAALFAGALADRLGRIGRFTLHEGPPPDAATFAARVGGAQAVILGWAMPDAVLETAPNLRLVAFTGIGAANHVDLALAARRGIAVCNTPGYADTTVAEHTLALLLALARQVPALERDMRAGGWARGIEGRDLAGLTLGLVGLGGIGTRVAALARAFGMEVMAWTAHPGPQRAAAAGVRFVELDALMAGADAISLHLALTAETRGLIDARRIGRMKPGAMLVNTARGELVDEDALVAALAEGRISAALDVFTAEPLAPDHPLRRLPNVVLTPHTGFNTPGARRAIFELAVRAVEAFHAGRPINLVTG